MKVGVAGSGFWKASLAWSLVEFNRYNQIIRCVLMGTALAKVVGQYSRDWLGRNSKVALVRNPSLLHIMATGKRSFLQLPPRRSSRFPDFSCARLPMASPQPVAKGHRRASLSTTEIAVGAPTIGLENSYEGPNG